MCSSHHTAGAAIGRTLTSVLVFVVLACHGSVGVDIVSVGSVAEFHCRCSTIRPNVSQAQADVVTV